MTSSTMTNETTTIQRNPLVLNETIIPRLWSDDLHSKLFASTYASSITKIISVVPPTVIDAGNATIRSRPVARRATSCQATAGTTNNSISSTHLGSKLAGDMLVAATVTFGVSPFLTVVDKAIVESTAGTNSILQSSINSLRSMARNPVEYVRSPTFLLMWGVYSATYTTANAFKTLEEHATYSRDRSSSSNTTQKSSGMFQMGAFLGTTVVNSGASMLKDRAYARMFSGTTSSTSFPKASYALWAMRDLSVISSSFLLPDLVSAKLVEHSNGEIDRERALSFCQIGLPVLAQFVAGPFQYLGLDVYNRNLGHMTTPQAIVDRSRQLTRGVAPVIAARVARIIPGYSIGGVANTKLRTAWRKKLLERDVAAMMKSSAANGRQSGGSNEYATRMVALLHGSNQGETKKRS
ncbi:unnamed protein product [Pseudo-nitzschia multistriata]|uniref:Mitochondrial fission process protein 1 n=1 Tax=Pseudo-nitzschia multistriata TaxID=183589 RepID=A0A448Z007_9STRA|nr:unnamed protein product [Pseudo-nitzschia multistriata]